MTTAFSCICPEQKTPKATAAGYCAANACLPKSRKSTEIEKPE